jgi:hypothetical protein
VDSTTQVVSILIIVLATVISTIVTQFARRRRDLFTLRPIPAYTVLPLLIGEGIEANRPVHISIGSAGIGANNTLLTLASIEFAYQVAQRAAIGSTSPILTLSDTSALPLAYDTLRRAYQSRGLLDRYPGGGVRWFPAGPRSLAFAAALTATLADDNVSANVLIGSFGTELALITDSAARRNQAVIASSDQLDGQAIAYATSTDTLIGEEMYNAGAYLGGAASQIASVVTKDILRWLLILGILIPTQFYIADDLRANGLAILTTPVITAIVAVELVLIALIVMIGSLRGLRRR